MIELGRPYADPRSERVITVVRNDPDGFELEARLPPGHGRLRPHLHLDFEQVFEVLEGRVAAAIAGGRRTLAAGERLDVPAAIAHEDPWNPGPEVAVLRNRIRPNPPFLPVFVETVLARMVAGRLPASGEPPALQVAVIARQTDGRSFLAASPVALQRRALPAVAALGRALGLRAETLPPT